MHSKLQVWLELTSLIGLKITEKHSRAYLNYKTWSFSCIDMSGHSFDPTTQYKVHSTDYTVHSTYYTVHSTHYTVHNTNFTVNSTGLQGFRCSGDVQFRRSLDREFRRWGVYGMRSSGDGEFRSWGV